VKPDAVKGSWQQHLHTAAQRPDLNADFVRSGVFTPPYPMVQIETPAKLSIAY
jgi:hypothetical protein